MKNFMKKFLWVIVYIALFVGVFGVSAFNKAKDIFGGELFANFALAGESAAEPLTEDEMKKEIVDIQYIKNDGTVDTRPMLICWPVKAEGDVPVVYIPHYELDESTADFVSYIKHGWAVASAYNFKPEYNGTLATDDLVFNNAALYAIRHMDGVDNQRIVLVGGSAGGYMTLMLNGLQMGTTASIANAPIANAYFNAHEYFPACDEVNRNSGLFDFTMPVQGMISKAFQPINDAIAADDVKTWEAVSPISMARANSNPLVICHNTADILVPVDQITHRYTYEKNDGTLPEGFNCHLPSGYPGILSFTFEELVDPNELTMNYSKFENNHVEGAMPYGDTLITININDDGAPTAKGSHSSPTLTGAMDIFPYLEDMMDRTLAKTEKLVPEKLLLLLERFQGNSIALPAHVGVDDTVYGSLAIYQKEIVDELNVWADNHSIEELDNAMQQAIKTISDNMKQEQYAHAWEKIQEQRND